MLSLLLLPTWEPGAAGGRQSAGGGRVRKRVRKRVAHILPPLSPSLCPLFSWERNKKKQFVTAFIQNMLSRSTIALAITGSAAAFAPIMSMDMGRREVTISFEPNTCRDGIEDAWSSELRGRVRTNMHWA